MENGFCLILRHCYQSSKVFDPFTKSLFTETSSRISFNDVMYAAEVASIHNFESKIELNEYQNTNVFVRMYLIFSLKSFK